MKDRDNYTTIADERDELAAEVKRLKSTLSADWKRAADGQKAEADTLRARVAELEAKLAKIAGNTCGPYGLPCSCTAIARAALAADEGA